MKVAIMYSGGKDSTFAIDHAMEKGWDIRYLISIKPTRTDCYLFHYATVEHTKELAKILKIPHILEKCSVADPQKEAEIVKRIVEKKPDVEVIRPKVSVEKPEAKHAEPSFKQTSKYKTLVAIMVIVFIGTAVFVVGGAFIVMRK